MAVVCVTSPGRGWGHTLHCFLFLPSPEVMYSHLFYRKKQEKLCYLVKVTQPGPWFLTLSPRQWALLFHQSCVLQGFLIWSGLSRAEGQCSISVMLREDFLIRTWYLKPYPIFGGRTAHGYVDTCMWRAEANLGCCPSVFTLFVETGSLTCPCTPWIGWAGLPVSPRYIPVFVSSVLEMQPYITILSFHMDARDWTWILKAVWQTLDWLRHSPSPMETIWKKIFNWVPGCRFWMWDIASPVEIFSFKPVCRL